MKNVAIIGAGFGGLALGLRLQAKGFNVTIYEKQELPGGHGVQFQKNGYLFDMGPSLITAPSIIEEAFFSAGENLSDYLDTTLLSPFYRIYFSDKTYLDYSGNRELMINEISKFSKNDAQQYDRFMDYSRKLYETVILERLGSQPFLSLADMLKAAPRLIQSRSYQSVYQVVSSFFKHEKIRFTFSFHPLFIGGNPFVTPALYLMIPYLEKEEGVWFSKGGMFSLVKAFEKAFIKKGGVIKVNHEVTDIIVKNRTAQGVTVNEKNIPYDLVVSNSHLMNTYGELISPKERKHWTDHKLQKMKYSMSCFLLYIGTKKQYPELKHHTLILSPRYKGLIDDIFNGKHLPDDFSLYLHAPTKSDPTMAPKGSESMYVLAPTANLNADIDWNSEGPKFKDRLLTFLEQDFGLTDLRKHAEVVEYFTPQDFLDKRNNHLGAAWGLQPVLLQSATFRAHNRSEDIKNLYLVGANTHPGAGLPGVLLTAETTEKVILQDHGENRNHHQNT